MRTDDNDLVLVVVVVAVVEVSTCVREEAETEAVDTARPEGVLLLSSFLRGVAERERLLIFV